jgi:FkbM family methyltransferase
MPEQGADGSHSYQGQDLFVLDVLGRMRGGYFLDSGASNGLKGSNTRLLESAFGWKGICVEPNEAMFRELVRNRSCICLHCCLYDRDGSVEFLEAAGVYGGIVEEYDPGHLRFTREVLADLWPRNGFPPTVRKKARTLRSVLREAKAPSVIDYWSLDTEGSELAILRSFPFDEFRFRVLTVEHNDTPVREDIRQFLESRGYRRVQVLGIDDGYVSEAELPSRAWRSAAWGGARRR